MAKEAREVSTDEEASEPVETGAGRSCSVCDTKLSSYNPGPNCWQHTIGHPWRGPSAKPRYD